MLKTIRVILAGLCLAGLTLLFAGIGGPVGSKLSFLAAVQLGPAVISGSFIVVAVLVVVTFLFGRLYCSIICPLGVTQDLISTLGKPTGFGYTPARSWLRLGSLAAFIVLMALGLPGLFGLLEPYSIFGRITVNLLEPLGVLAHPAEAAGLEPAPDHFGWPRGGWGLGAVSLLSLAVIIVLSWRAGRAWCHNLCPLGTFLGFVSRFSVFGPRIEAAKCTGCGRCERKCKSGCLDSAAMNIDYSRCVGCFSCLAACPHEALEYSGASRAKNQPR